MHSSFDPTVLEPSAQDSLGAARASRVASRAGVVRNSETHVAPRRRQQAAEATGLSPAKVVGVAVVVLALACAAAGIVLVRRSGASAQAAETQTLAPSDATSGASGDGLTETQSTTAPARNSTANTPAQDAPSDFGRATRAGSETTATDAQNASGVNDSSGASASNAAGGAQPAASNNVSPSTDASGGDRQGLVVRSASDPSARAAAIEAEVDERARRAEEAQRQATQAPQPDARRPPPPGGHRPPPPGGHPPPRYPPPRP